ncbi:hypothetical protein RCH18_000399 [Flavobacterium sp. PL11]|jgi:hypothetical protein|nr:hypothetical protein [Flavobacterium sp. PL11]
MKNLKPLHLYFISIICFVLANLLRDSINFAYGFLLGFGVIVFLFAIYKKVKN